MQRQRLSSSGDNTSLSPNPAQGAAILSKILDLGHTSSIHDFSYGGCKTLMTEMKSTFCWRHLLLQGTAGEVPSTSLTISPT